MLTSACSRAPFVRDLINALPRRAYTTRATPTIRRQAFQPRISQTLQRRHATLFTGNVRSNLRKHFRQSPVVTSVAAVLSLFGITAILFLPYLQYQIYGYHEYPEEVAVELRKAIQAKMQKRYPESVEHYKAALEKAKELQMDCWTDEIFGVKLRIVEVLEAADQYDKAVMALELFRKDNLDAMTRHKDNPERKKTLSLLLRQAIAASTKLAELYSRPEVWHREAAERHLSWAFETSIAESQRRARLKITEEQEGPWMSLDQISATAENLAATYEAKDQNYLASPLYLHAINLQQVKNCHTVVMMNNLASSLAQQSPRAATVIKAKMDSQSINQGSAAMPVSREMLLQMGQAWAQNALNLAGTIAPPQRTDECDTGCAVALHNLGEIAEMLKDVEGAKKQYREAISLARAIGFKEGIEASSARLRELEKR